MRDRHAGFSLVELLVALSIFSLLTSVLMGGYSQGLYLWERSQHESSRWLSVQNRHELLRKVFVNALFADYPGSDGQVYPHFFANQDQIEFTTRAAILDQPGRVRPVRILVRQYEDGTSDLLYQEGGRHNDLGRGIAWDQPRTVKLMDNISNPRFRFLAPAFPLPTVLATANLTQAEELRFREHAEWLNWYDGKILWRTPLLIEFAFTDEAGVRHEWSFSVPWQTDAWSLRGYLDDV